MNRPATFLMTLTLIGALQANPSGKGQAEKEAFFGHDTATWLPKASTLPSAADVTKAAEELSSRTRNVDPFGVAMFPREGELPYHEQGLARVTAKVTLNQALQTLKLNGINLTNKEFLIGGRNVFEGDILELGFRNEVFRALVVEVGATQILFRDLDRDETGVLPHNIIRRLEMEPINQAPSPLESRMVPLEPLTSRTP